MPAISAVNTSFDVLVRRIHICIGHKNQESVKQNRS